MKFQTELERSNHPLVSLIPKNIWDFIFKQEIDYKFLEFMQEQDETSLLKLIKSLSNDFIRIDYPAYEKKVSPKIKLWLAIAFSHPHITNETLENIAVLLDISRDSLFKMSISLSNTNFWNYLLEQYEDYLKFIISVDAGGILLDACKYGKKEIIEFIVDASPTVLENHGSEALINAVGSDQLEVVKIFEQRFPEIFTSNLTECFKTASRAASSSTLGYLETKLTAEEILSILKSPSTAFEDYSFGLEVALAAIVRNNLNLLQFIEKKLTAEELKPLFEVEPFVFFSAFANLSTLSYLEKYLTPLWPKLIADPNSSELLSEIIKDAISIGNVDVLRYLEEKIPIAIFQPLIANFTYLLSAAENGQLNLLNYITGKLIGGNLEEKHSPNILQNLLKEQNYLVFKAAAKEGHLEIIKYLMGQTSPETLRAMLKDDNNAVIKLAVNHYEMVQHIFSQVKQISEKTLQEIIKANNFELYSAALERGDLKTIKLLFEYSSKDQIQLMINSNYEAFTNAAVDKNLDNIIFIMENSSDQRAIIQYLIKNKGFRSIIYTSNFKVLNFLTKYLSQADLIRILNYDDASPILYQLVGSNADEALDSFLYLKKTLPQDLLEFAISNTIPGNFYPKKKFMPHVLEYLKVFIYAEQHVYEFGPEVSEFVTKKLKELDTEKKEFESTNSGIFDVSDIDAKFLFYVLRNLIRRNDPSPAR